MAIAIKDATLALREIAGVRSQENFSPVPISRGNRRQRSWVDTAVSDADYLPSPSAQSVLTSALDGRFTALSVHQPRQASRFDAFAGGYEWPPGIDCVSSGLVSTSTWLATPTPFLEQMAIATVDSQIRTAKSTIYALRAAEKIKSPYRFRTEQEWVGRVDGLDGEYFAATLQDRRNPDSAETHTELRLEAVSPAERQLIQPGAMFYWILGYEDTNDGTRSYVSRIRCQRTPVPTAREVSNYLKRGRARRTRLAAGDDRG